MVTFCSCNVRSQRVCTSRQIIVTLLRISYEFKKAECTGTDATTIVLSPLEQRTDKEKIKLKNTCTQILHLSSRNNGNMWANEYFEYRVNRITDLIVIKNNITSKRANKKIENRCTVSWAQWKVCGRQKYRRPKSRPPPRGSRKAVEPIIAIIVYGKGTTKKINSRSQNERALEFSSKNKTRKKKTDLWTSQYALLQFFNASNFV